MKDSDDRRLSSTGVPFGAVWLNDNNTAARVIVGTSAVLATATTVWPRLQRE